MEHYKAEFIEFMVRCGVLTFGDFMTKSGRKTPYFINTGLYRTGSQMMRLGGFYKDAIEANLPNPPDVLFGPAYKGIPLVVATAIRMEPDVAFCFNRKEVKDHGEGGAIIGHKLRDGDRVLIIEDVTTAGTSIRETVPLMRAAADVELAGLVVSVDRMERGTTEKSALSQVSEEFQMPTFAIVNLDEIIAHLKENQIDGKWILDDRLLERIADYRAQYGAVAG